MGWSPCLGACDPYLTATVNDVDVRVLCFTRLRRKPWLPVLRSSLLRKMDQDVEECVAGVLRSLGEGGHASAGFAEDTRGTTAVKPWVSTVFPFMYYNGVTLRSMLRI